MSMPRQRTKIQKIVSAKKKIEMLRQNSYCDIRQIKFLPLYHYFQHNKLSENSRL